MHGNRTAIGHRHAIGFTRRELIQVGYSGLLGMGLPSLLAGRAGPRAAADGPRGKGKSVLLIFLTGAPSHIDTFDLKPEAPDEIRGDFQPIATKVPGCPGLRAPAAAWRRGPTSSRSSAR